MASSNPHLRLLAAATLLFALPARGGELRYGAPLHEAGWEVSVSRQECRMAQEIPYYGRAVFSRQAGRDLVFTVSARQHAPREGEAQLLSVPPNWIHSAAVLDLGRVASIKGADPFVLPGDQARRLLAELEKGMSPTLTYKDWGDRRDQVVVSVSAIHLRKSLPLFLDCLNRLLPYDFNAVRSSVLNFGLASHSLDPADRRRLEKVAEYALEDESVTGILIAGYTDNTGFRRYNRELSQKRAEAVRAFLAQQGIKTERLKIEVHGERDPRASNRTDDGRARNRRVEVTLLR